MLREFAPKTVCNSSDVFIAASHDIYKWQSDQRRQGMRVRSASYAGTPPAPPDPAFEHIHEPGGFRRNYVLLRANEQGTEEPRILNNFIDFLFIFGHFVR
jgi:solute carrier family 36 (proton-coupled amino acid transporter)